jgi:hypothetical protein
LRIGKQAHKVRTVPRLDVVALQMQRNVAKRSGVAVNVQRLDGAVSVDALVGGGLELAEKVLRKVRRGIRG